MSKKYMVYGTAKVIATAIFEDDGVTDLDDQAMDAITELFDISENCDPGEEAYLDDWEIVPGSLKEI